MLQVIFMVVKYKAKDLLFKVYQDYGIKNYMSFDEFILSLRREVAFKYHYIISAVDYKEMVYKFVDFKMLDGSILWLLED